MPKNTTINLRVDSEVKEQSDIVAFRHTPKRKTMGYIEQVETKAEPLVGPFFTKEELWKSLGI